ncbi:hypothetical protein CYMTET_27072 [Cymbomonas tetramitiformis]|uniref:Uncharacterized protein n=1 Tax=Cymbomonas tetramitiformis TaxID=36881 RepID=A0AAE0FR48_9CHLO|nr:hypothetical protein CYMTET_27072 [Cymbomonas tetramitiformis]
MADRLRFREQEVNATEAVLDSQPKPYALEDTLQAYDALQQVQRRAQAAEAEVLRLQGEVVVKDKLVRELREQLAIHQGTSVEAAEASAGQVAGLSRACEDAVHQLSSAEEKLRHMESLLETKETLIADLQDDLNIATSAAKKAADMASQAEARTMRLEQHLHALELPTPGSAGTGSSLPTPSAYAGDETETKKVVEGVISMWRDTCAAREVELREVTVELREATVALAKSAERAERAEKDLDELRAQSQTQVEQSREETMATLEEVRRRTQRQLEEVRREAAQQAEANIKEAQREAEKQTARVYEELQGARRWVQREAEAAEGKIFAVQEEGRLEMEAVQGMLEQARRADQLDAQASRDMQERTLEQDKRHARLEARLEVDTAQQEARLEVDAVKRQLAEAQREGKLQVEGVLLEVEEAKRQGRLAVEEAKREVEQVRREGLLDVERARHEAKLAAEAASRALEDAGRQGERGVEEATRWGQLEAAAAARRVDAAVQEERTRNAALAQTEQAARQAELAQFREHLGSSKQLLEAAAEREARLEESIASMNSDAAEKERAMCRLFEETANALQEKRRRIAEIQKKADHAEAEIASTSETISSIDVLIRKGLEDRGLGQRVSDAGAQPVQLVKELVKLLEEREHEAELASATSKTLLMQMKVREAEVNAYRLESQVLQAKVNPSPKSPPKTVQKKKATMGKLQTPLSIQSRAHR